MSKNFKETSYLFGSNAVFIEELYNQYLLDPNSVDKTWQEFFSHNNYDIKDRAVKTTAKIISTNHENSHFLEKPATTKAEPIKNSTYNERILNSLKAKFMIRSYRERGHYLSNLDPLSLEKNKTRDELKLNLRDFGFDKIHLSETIDLNGELSDNITACTLNDLINLLECTYSGSIAVEFSHVENIDEQKWLYNSLENANINANITTEEKKKILQDLVEVEGFEQYLHKRFSGAKRFSIEGGDAAILCLDKVIDLSAFSGVKKAVLGLAHRGRLSTLAKVMKKPYRAIMSEFLGTTAFPSNLDISGDVKYHMGFSSDKIMTDGHKIHLSLTPNPSHLEAVNPVVAGKVRAQQDCLGRKRNKVVGILVHGDTAFCGQGVVSESLVMSGLKPYDIGGIIHLVINNQIGFTANAKDSRVGRYCTEVVKIVGAPIMHVNGDDIEAVMRVTKIACDYRSRFNKDIVIDIICYRKYGHNEGDEPMYTQSMMYNVIKNKQTPAEIYTQKLIDQGIIDKQYYDKLKEKFKLFLDNEFAHIEHYKPKVHWLQDKWEGFERFNNDKIKTGVDKSILKKIGNKLSRIPDSFDLNKKLSKLFANRETRINEGKKLDWATAEQLAYASLLQEGFGIRMTGQDARRGTFSHRHAVLHSQKDASIYEPLNNLSQDQGFFEIADSNLSEYAVLGFEYGYSLVNPSQLVIWEAQFGDFCNGAQIIFDQFISSSETKWLRMSGLVCFLPHAMEGQGPEHSSARLERFLQLCAENNMQVVYPTTPSSIFHLLRRQLLRKFRKPLIVMSPKSLLRHKLAVSDISDLDKNTSFSPIIDEIDQEINYQKVTKIIFCSGKIYYDLLESRREKNITNIAIIRLEQLYPFEHDLIIKIIKKYNNAKKYVWCQEEPKNMGAWRYIRAHMEKALCYLHINKEINFVGRDASASPAVGYLNIHNQQQTKLINDALV